MTQTPTPPPTTTTPAGSWRVIITDWALNSYLSMKHSQVFSDQEYWTVLRPDVELLRDGIPSPHTKFANNKFWGPATLAGAILTNGFKMKWHQVGSGKVQLRLPVAVGSQETFLCEAYVKLTPSVEARMLARFKTYMNLIALGRYTYRGSL